MLYAFNKCVFNFRNNKIDENLKKHIYFERIILSVRILIVKRRTAVFTSNAIRALSLVNAAMTIIHERYFHCLMYERILQLPQGHTLDCKVSLYTHRRHFILDKFFTFQSSKFW